MAILWPPVASFLQIFRARMPIRPLLILLLATSLLACRDKDGPRPTSATPAKLSQEEEAAIKAAPGELKALGQVAFRGASSYFCVPHGEGGLQVDFRTGSQEMPAVAVRIDAYHGSGPYPAHLFVTGRSATGALVTSTGEGSLDVQQQDPVEGGAPALVSGAFKGRYGGEAGAGEVEGRFESCNYTPYREGEKQPAGAAEETHERPSDASRLSAHSRAGGRGSRHRAAATGRRGHRARSPHGSGRPRGRGRRGKGVRGAG
ncbi:MAG TPA: hypothetical protein VFR03_12225 [Thermoanaerobaculia bacterium]|nr:hypothetical protein [Thermoanaerobaculia bacterium]